MPIQTDQTVTTIVLFHVPPDSSSAFLAAWSESNAFMSAQPGLIGGTLFQATSDEAEPLFVNVATWTTQAALDEARTRHADILADQGIDQREVWAKLGVTVSPVSYHAAVRYDGPDLRADESGMKALAASIAEISKFPS